MKRLLVLCLVLWTATAHATVNEVLSKNDYTANGATTVFPYTFKVLDKADIQVLVNGTAQIVDTNYSVSGLGDSGGGSVTFLIAPANGAKVTILRDQPVQQLSNYTANEGFPATRLMNDLDKNIMVDQQQIEAIGRALKFKPESTFKNIAVADPVANQCLVWNASGTMVNSQSCSAGGGGGGGGTGAPLTATYLLKTADSLLPNAQAMGALGTGLVLNTTVSGTQSIYTGTACSNQFVRGLSAAGVATCASINMASDVTGLLGPTFGGTGATALTQGSVPFIGTSGVYSQDNANLFWDNTNDRLGIGTASPSTKLHVLSSVNEAVGTGRIEYVTTTTTGTFIPFSVVSTVNGAMIDGFATGINFFLRDNDGVDNVAARIVASRSGADATGTYAVQTGIAGSVATRLLIDAAGAVTLSNLASAGTSCVQVNSAGKLAVSGAACGTVVMVDAAHGGTNTDSSASTGLALVTAGTWTYTLTPTVTSLTATSLVSGSLTTSAQGALVIGPFGVSSGNTGEVRYLERLANGSNYVGFRAPDSIAANIVWTLPATDSTGTQCLASNGSGVLSWGACSGGGASGITSLNGLTGATQTFTNDTNVTITSGGTAHVLGFTGTLASARGGFGVDTSASTGVPSVIAGVWSIGSQLAKSLGGTGGTGGASGQASFWTGTTLTGDTNFLWDTTNVRLTVGSGSTASAGASGTTVFTATGAPVGNAAVARIESNGGGTSSTRTVLQLVHSLTGSQMVDAYGVRQDFVLRDVDAVDNLMARFEATRTTNDQTSTFNLQTAVNGVLSNRIGVDNSGIVFSGTGDQFQILGGTAPIPALWRLAYGTTASPQTTHGGVFTIFNKQGVSDVTGCINRVDPNCASAFNVIMEKTSGSSIQGTAAYFALVNNSTAATSGAGGDAATVYIDAVQNNPNGYSNGLYIGSQRNVNAVFHAGEEILLSNTAAAGCSTVDANGSTCAGLNVYYLNYNATLRAGGIAYRMQSLDFMGTGGGGRWQTGYYCAQNGATRGCFEDYSNTAAFGISLVGTYSNAAIQMGTGPFNGGVKWGGGAHLYESSGVLVAPTGLAVGSTHTGNTQFIVDGSPSANGGNIQLYGNGGTTPSKFLRTFNGAFEIVNHAYGATILKLTDAGALFIPALATGTPRTLCIRSGGEVYSVASGAACT